MLKVMYSPAALKDLKELNFYIESNWGETIAKETINKIVSKVKILEQFPLLGVSLSEKVDIPTEYRYLFTENNYIFYRLEDNIVRVINEHQDYMTHLFGENYE